MLNNDPSISTERKANSEAPVMSVKNWMLTLFLAAIPLVNIIMLFVWAFGRASNPNKANYAKASLIWTAIGIVIYIVLFIVFYHSMSTTSVSNINY